MKRTSNILDVQLPPLPPLALFLVDLQKWKDAQSVPAEADPVHGTMFQGENAPKNPLGTRGTERCAVGCLLLFAALMNKLDAIYAFLDAFCGMGGGGWVIDTNHLFDAEVDRVQCRTPFRCNPHRMKCTEGLVVG
jgi:hypothetical protein